MRYRRTFLNPLGQAPLTGNAHKVVIAGYVLVGIFAVVSFVSITVNEFQKPVGKQAARSANTASATNLPSSAKESLTVIGQDEQAVGAAATAGEAIHTAALCTQLRDDVEAAGANDGWTPTDGKSSIGLDGLYVEVLNQAHQAAEACIAGDYAGAGTHINQQSAAIAQLSSGLGR